MCRIYKFKFGKTFKLFIFLLFAIQTTLGYGKTLEGLEENSQTSSPAPETSPPIYRKSDPSWMVPLLSAQHCAYEKAHVLTLNKTQFLLNRKLMSNEEAKTELQPIQSSLDHIKQQLSHFKRRTLSCRTAIVKKLLRCLPSVKALQIEEIGAPYYAEWCWKDPYLAFVEIETGQQDRSRSFSKVMSPEEVVHEIRLGLEENNIFPEEVNMRMIEEMGPKKNQILTVILPQELEVKTEELLEALLARYRNLLKRTHYKEIIVKAQGPFPHQQQHRL